MLVLTEAAAEVVKSVTTDPQAPADSGLRISSSAPMADSAEALKVSAAPSPGENDQVIEAAGARVFVAPQAVAFLDDKILDASLDEAGRASFSLGVQQPR